MLLSYLWCFSTLIFRLKELVVERNEVEEWIRFLGGREWRDDYVWIEG